jgi:hypothetical protein
MSTSNFGCGHASRRPLSNLPLVTARLKWPERRKKGKKLIGNVEISGVSRQILAGVEMSNLKKGSRVTPPVDLYEKTQYMYFPHTIHGGFELTSK